MIAAFILAMGLQADFLPNATLPKRNVYAECGGANVSPTLRWSGAPPRTRSFVLTVFDPDAPRAGGWWHWIAYNILPEIRGLAAGSGSAGSMNAGTFGKNDFGDANYDGPCPPPGKPHRYVFTLYALERSAREHSERPGRRGGRARTCACARANHRPIRPLAQTRVKRRIESACRGKDAMSASRFAISNPANSNPGATLQPTSA